MHYYTNHCYCTKSHWNDDNFDCRNIVSIHKCPEGGDHWTDVSKDWKLVEEVENCFLDEFKLKVLEKRMDTDQAREMASSDSYRLKPNVMEWLRNNIKDVGKEKGWCVGNDAYNKESCIQFNVFFKRKRDAMNFIKEFSEFKKPETYFDYFNNIRKKLNKETGKLELVDEL